MNYCEPINLQTYIARQSIMSSTSKPLDCVKEDFNLKSEFQKNMICSDFTKNAFVKYKNDRSDYILIDLIDERFDLLSYNESIITFSSELKNSKFIENPKYIKQENIVWSNSHDTQEKDKTYSLRDGLDKFIDEILSIYECENIILHKAYMVDSYIGNNGMVCKFSTSKVKTNKTYNEKIKRMYNYMEEKMECFCIDVTDKYLADERNKWGLATMHYEESYYIEVANIIQEYVYQRMLEENEKFN